MQRHHILPRQLLNMRCFEALFDDINPNSLGFDDFRHNGLLLPSCEGVAKRLSLPLHRGPHKRYNAMAAERLGEVEARWSRTRRQNPLLARDEARLGAAQLQLSLKHRLLDRKDPLVLNRRDPIGSGVDFSTMDAMAETLWQTSAPIFDERDAELATFRRLRLTHASLRYIPSRVGRPCRTLVQPT